MVQARALKAPIVGSKLTVEEAFPVTATIIHDDPPGKIQVKKITNIAILDSNSGRWEFEGETAENISFIAGGLLGTGKATVHTIL